MNGTEGTAFERALDPMTVERQVSLLFAVNAVINWTVSVRGIVDPVGAALSFGGAAPNYPSVVRLWQGFVFMFGCLFWEASRDVRGKVALLKYNWIEKTITATAITVGYFAGDIPARLMILIVLTNWLWIPFIIWGDFAVRKGLKAKTGAAA
jgi:hypothetical protein